MSFILSAIANKGLNIVTNNFNLLLTRYNLLAKYKQNLNNKHIVINIYNKNYIWHIKIINNNLYFEFNAQTSSYEDLSLSDISDSISNKLYDLIIIIPHDIDTLFKILTNNKNNKTYDNIFSKIKINGDAYLASNLVKLIQSLNINLEDILSLKLPPSLAYILSEFIKKQINTSKYALNSLLTTTNNYLVNEKQIIISNLEFQDFENHNIQLRDDIDRIEQKIKKLN